MVSDTGKYDKFNADLTKMVIDVTIMRNDINKIQEDVKEIKEETSAGIEKLRTETKDAIYDLKTELKNDLDPLYSKIDKWKDFLIYALLGISGSTLLTLVEFFYNYVLKNAHQ